MRSETLDGDCHVRRRMVVLPALMRFGDGISRITKAVGGLVGATKNNVFGSLYKFGAASLAAGTAFRLLDGISEGPGVAGQFRRAGSDRLGACSALVRVMDRMNKTADTFGKKADFFNKLGGLALAISRAGGDAAVAGSVNRWRLAFPVCGAPGHGRCGCL